MEKVFTEEEVLTAAQNAKIHSWCDLYAALGIDAMLEPLGRYDVKYVRASAELQNKIREIIKANLQKKYKRHYLKRTIDTMEAMDNMCYSPKNEENLQGIKILLA